jgi:hypothetical protein
MNDRICFADAELPFHVWVRERRGDEGYRWVLREARPSAGDEVRTPEGSDGETAGDPA